MTSKELIDLITKSFNLEEIRSLCLDLGIEYENLPGNTRIAKATELVLFCERRGRLGELVTLCTRERPNTSWKRISNQTESPQTTNSNLQSLVQTPQANQSSQNHIESKHKSSVVWGAILAALFVIGAIADAFGAWDGIKGLVQSNIEPTPVEVEIMENVTLVPVPTNVPTPILPTTTSLPEAVNVATNPPVLPTVEPTMQPTASPTYAAIYTPTTETVNGYTYVLIPAKSSAAQTNEVDEFWLGAYEITNLWFAIYLNSINSNNKCSNGSLCFDAQSPTARISRQNSQWVVDEGYENHPVTDVTWHGAADYCQAIEGRLPTHDEWIHAASWNPITNDVMPYPWGNTLPSSEFANYNNHINDTRPVGSYQSGRTLLGVYDMLGNVWEFIANTRGINRTALGGGWDTPQNQLIIGTSYPANETTTSSNLGFRCAR